MLKTLIIATMLLPRLAIAQQSQQLPQLRQPGQWCPVGGVASGNYCAPTAPQSSALAPPQASAPAPHAAPAKANPPAAPKQ
jgi:hypothetical protein